MNFSNQIQDQQDFKMAILKLVFCLAVLYIAYGQGDNVLGKLWSQGTICYHYDSSVTESLYGKQWRSG